MKRYLHSFIFSFFHSFILLYIGWLVVGLLASCTGRDERAALRRAESLMETDAVAASAALDSILPATLRGEARARYALLRTQADYKNYVPLTSDSLILIATRHYGTRRQTLPAALAQYYLGCAYKETGRDLDAIDALLRATTLFPDSTHKYYAYCLSELGLLYLDHHMPDKAVSAFGAYSQYGKNVCDTIIMGKADYHLGRAYLRMLDNSKAKEAFYRVINNTAIDSSFKNVCLYQLAKISFYTDNDIDLSDYYVNQYLKAYSNSNQIGAGYLLKADIEKASSNIDSAYSYYRRALDCTRDYATKCMIYKGLSEIAPYLLPQDSTSSYVKKYTAYIDSVYTQNHRNEINELITNHTIELHDREMAERHNRLLWMLGVCALFVVAGAAISVLAIKKRQQEKYSARINGLQDKVRQLSNDLAQAMESRSDMAADDEPADDVLLPSATVAEGDSLFLQLIDSSVKLYVERNRRMHEALMNYNPSLDMDMETRRQVISTLDLSFAELTSTLLLYYPTLKREEVRTAVCSLLGYRPKLTSELFSVTLSGLRSRKQRLKSKLPEQIFALFYPQQEENCPSGDSDNQ